MKTEDEYKNGGQTTKPRWEDKKGKHKDQGTDTEEPKKNGGKKIQADGVIVFFSHPLTQSPVH